MPDREELRRNVLADAIKDGVLQGIMDGSYPAGSRIMETRLAREFDISQAPVREALRGLQALGVVEITPFRGARVRWPTRDELIEAYVVRSEVEALGARLAMKRMTDDELGELLEYGNKMQEAARKGDGHAVAAADASFHGRLIELAGNGTLVRVWRSLEPFSRTYITLVAPGADPHWTADLHGPMLDALKSRDSRALVRAVRHHFAEAGSNLASRWTDPPPEAGDEPVARKRRKHE
ncbi:MAG: GntR family transcriptional regulator [Acidimicrobiales bacterium]|jgi:DNA-binding GntR family transcriptional regulator